MVQMVRIESVKQCVLLLCIALSFSIAGCVKHGAKNGGKRIVCQIMAVNNATNDIRFVAVNSGMSRNEFGFLSSMGAGKVRLFCEFDLCPLAVITWEEDGERRTGNIDMEGYVALVNSIMSLDFVYLGNNEWRVVVRSDTEGDSPEIHCK
jgi:hypothetical protein